jgi:hypothetical protein
MAAAHSRSSCVRPLTSAAVKSDSASSSSCGVCQQRIAPRVTAIARERSHAAHSFHFKPPVLATANTLTTHTQPCTAHSGRVPRGSSVHADHVSGCLLWQRPRVVSACEQTVSCCPVVCCAVLCCGVVCCDCCARHGSSSEATCCTHTHTHTHTHKRCPPRSPQRSFSQVAKPEMAAELVVPCDATGSHARAALCCCMTCWCGGVRVLAQQQQQQQQQQHRVAVHTALPLALSAATHCPALHHGTPHNACRPDRAQAP